MDQTRSLFWGLIGLAVLIILGVLVLGAVSTTERVGRRAGAATRVALDATAVAVTATAVVLPTPGPVTEGAGSAADRATAERAFAVAPTWTLLFFDTFDDNRHGWNTGSADGDLLRGVRAVEDGLYYWDMDARENFTLTSAPLAVPYNRYYAAVTVDRRNHGVGGVNLLFRYQDSDNYYDFGLCATAERGAYQVWRQYEDAWTELIPCTPHTAILPDAPNTLALIVDGSAYHFFANEQYLATWRDARVRGDLVGLSVDLQAGEDNLFSFDDYEVRADLP